MRRGMSACTAVAVPLVLPRIGLTKLHVSTGPAGAVEGEVLGAG